MLRGPGINDENPLEKATRIVRHLLRTSCISVADGWPSSLGGDLIHSNLTARLGISAYTVCANQAGYGFQTPIDEVDAAARILDPVR
eukprot:COSAG01_NODE_5828_length_4007_cov_15.721597_2_plen_87_part_00